MVKHLMKPFSQTDYLCVFNTTIVKPYDDSRITEADGSKPRHVDTYEHPLRQDVRLDRSCEIVCETRAAVLFYTAPFPARMGF
jgi:hypothetical protein